MGSIEAAAMATTISSGVAQRGRCAFYEIDPRTGATIEIFCADSAFAQSFGARAAGWYWRQCSSPKLPSGPFVTCYAAYRDATLT